jgi:hypothetical protein
LRHLNETIRIINLGNVQELMVFIASPGDLGEERDAVRRAADYINSLFSAIYATRLTITSGDQSQPAFGRPQEIINPLVKQCDIFIGLLNRKWGTPTGKYSSGFEEEYVQAAELAKEHGSPRLGIFFKEVPDEMLQDAGPSLSKVLEFRRKLETQHIAFFKQFSTVNDFELQVTHYLMTIVVERSHRDTSSSPEGTVDKASSTELSSVAPETPVQDEAMTQIASTLYGFYHLVEEGEVGDTFLDSDRLLLFSMAVQSEMLSIPIHSINRIYGKRDEYAISVIEYRLIVWTVAENFHYTPDGSIRSFAPGFKIIMAAGSSSDLEQTLVSQILEQSSEFAVANGSLAILSAMKARPAELWGSPGISISPPASVSEVVSNAEQNPFTSWIRILEIPRLRDAALNYISTVIRDSDYSLFMTISERVNDARLAAQLIALAEYAVGNISGICQLVSAHYISKGSCFENMLGASISRMNEEQLSAVVLGRLLPTHLVRNAFNALSHFRTPTAEEFSKLLKSKENALIGVAFDTVRRGDKAATLNLLAAAAKFKDDKSDEGLDEYRYRLRAMVQTEEELRAELSSPWSFVDAWSTLSWLCGAELADEAREILDTDCSKALDSEKLQEAGYDEKLQVFLKSLLRRSALSLLARIPVDKRDDQDVHRFRRELARDERVTAAKAVEGLALVGSSEDVERFLSLAANHYGEEKKTMLQCAVRLGGLETARKMITDSDEDVALAGARVLSADASTPLSELQSHLYSIHDTVRMVAWKAVEKRMSRGELEEYLDEYRSRAEGYYYDVVAALDRKLYMPH